MMPWSEYLAGYHEDWPGITERLLGPATGRRQERPYQWLVEPWRGRTDVILDLACGSAPTRDLLRTERWLGVDVSPGELAVARHRGRRPVLRARGDRLPIADGTVGAVCAAMCLPVVTPLDAVLAELTRVLRPGGILVALVPSRMGLDRGLPGWVADHAGTGCPVAGLAQCRRSRRASQDPARARFVVDHSRRRVFRRDIRTPRDADLLVEGLYLPGVGAERIEAARAALASWTRPGRRLPFPLRRVIAHLPETEI